MGSDGVHGSRRLGDLSGRGLFVNQVMSAGLSELITDNEIAQVAEQATVLGVSPAFELCDITRPEVVALLSKDGWQRRDQSVVLVHALRSIAKPVEGIDVALAAEAEVPIWQGVSAAGWGHTSALAVAANDAVAAAASVADGPGLLLVCDGADGRSLA